jgi:hypothetical protein
LAGFAVAVAASVANLTRLRAFSRFARNDGVTAPQRKPFEALARGGGKSAVGYCRSKPRSVAHRLQRECFIITGRRSSRRN